MPPLRRHQLAFLQPSAWHELLRRDGAEPVQAGLRHWQQHRLPWVVTRQPAPRITADAPVHLGLPMPACWGRQPVSMAVAPDEIEGWGEFPLLADVIPLLSPDDRAEVSRLDQDLQALDVPARAYGSFGWQQLTGLAYVHPRSDLDLWLAVGDAAQADRAVQALARGRAGVRLDGELMFPDGRAVAWREWQAWRSGAQQQVMVKRLDGVALVSAGFGRAEEGAWPRAA